MIGNLRWPEPDEVWIKSPTQTITVGVKFGSWPGDNIVLSARQDGDWWKYKLSGTILGERSFNGLTYDAIVGKNFKCYPAFNYNITKSIALLNNVKPIVFETTWIFGGVNPLYLDDSLVDTVKNTSGWQNVDIRPLSEYPYH